MSMETEEGRPRAFYPDYVGRVQAVAETPGWDLATERQLTDGRTLARGLGWFSIGLGVMQLVAPRSVTGFLGLDDRHTALVRFYGVREIASGVAILAERTPVRGVWSRVGGDALDLGTLGTLAGESDARGNVMLAMGMVAGIAALDTKCALQLGGLPDTDGGRRRAA